VGAFLFVLKPFLYLVVMIVASLVFERHASGPGWMAVLLATMMRLVLGVGGAWISNSIFDAETLPVAFWSLIFVFGVAWWALSIRTFYRGPRWKLALFALTPELLFIGVDYMAAQAVANTRGIC
jgi:hypothetical protein